jgi:hypothetical protein
MMPKSLCTAQLVAMRAYAFAAVVIAVASISNTAAAIDSPRPASCLNRFSDVVTIGDDFGPSQYVNTLRRARIGIDAFDAIWRPEPVNDQPLSSSIILTTGTQGCWAGGRVLGKSVRQLRESRGADAALSISGRAPTPIDFELEWVEFYNVPRAIEVSSTFTRLRLNRVFLREIRESCISFQGRVHTLHIRNTLVDGCSYLVDNSSGGVLKENTQFVIRDSLIRLQARQSRTSFGIQGIKIGSRPKVDVINTTFLLEGSVPLLQSLVADGQVILGECRGNIVVVTNKNTMIGQLPSCFRITTNKKVWTTSKKAWLEARERQIRRNKSHRPQLEEMASRRDSNSSQDFNEDASAGVRVNANQGQSANRGGQAPVTDEPSLAAAAARLAIQPSSGAVLGSKWSDGTMWNDKTGWF